MEKQWREALSGFDAVWQRVQERTPPPALPEIDRGKAALEQLLCAVAAAAAAYRGAGTRSQTLQRLAGECLADLRRLRAEYYLLYGLQAAPATATAAQGELPRQLRQAYLCEKTVGEQCDAAAIAAGDAGARALCTAVAERSQARRAVLFDLLCRTLR